MTRVWVGAVLAFAAVQAGCGSPTEPLLDLRLVVPDVTEYVTEELRPQLDGAGHFAAAWACSTEWGQPRGFESSEELAVSIARRYLSANSSPFGQPIGPILSEQHGHPVDWRAVTVGLRATVCAESILEPLPDTLHPAALNHYGPAYLVPLYVEGDQVAVASVAALSGLYVDDEGLQNYVGNELRFGTPPHGHSFGVPPSAEAVVRHASRETGAKIARLPRLLKPGHEIVAYQTKWELVLDRRISCTRVTDGFTLDVDTVYAGLYPSFTDPVMRSGLPMRLFVQDTVQPTEVMVRNVGDKGELELMSWPLRPGVAVDFWEVDCQA